MLLKIKLLNKKITRIGFFNNMPDLERNSKFKGTAQRIKSNTSRKKKKAKKIKNEVENIDLLGEEEKVFERIINYDELSITDTYALISQNMEQEDEKLLDHIKNMNLTGRIMLYDIVTLSDDELERINETTGQFFDKMLSTWIEFVFNEQSNYTLKEWIKICKLFTVFCSKNPKPIEDMMLGDYLVALSTFDNILKPPNDKSRDNTKVSWTFLSKLGIKPLYYSNKETIFKKTYFTGDEIPGYYCCPSSVYLPCDEIYFQDVLDGWIKFEMKITSGYSNGIGRGWVQMFLNSFINPDVDYLRFMGIEFLPFNFSKNLLRIVNCDKKKKSKYIKRVKRCSSSFDGDDSD